MSIPESQLETWSHQGAITTSRNTYASIKGTLEAWNTSYANSSFEVFLQGSYSNDTNIYADSDVDIVIILTSIFRADTTQLPLDQILNYGRHFSTAIYQLADFKDAVVSQLRNVYGYLNVHVGNKAVKIDPTVNRLGADVVVSHEYRYYRYFYGETLQSYDQGIIFTTSWGANIINYPKLHSQNCTDKHQNTGRIFKPMVRIFKNMRNRLIDDGVIAEDLAPSYFIEGLLYNVPDDKFDGEFGDTFCNCVNWLRNVDRSGFLCANRMHLLFGNTAVQWDNIKCTQFLNGLADLWNGW
jgi:hypothetical protein